MLQPGTDVDVTVEPSVTFTTAAAREGFSPAERKCYDCNEVRSDPLLLLPSYHTGEHDVPALHIQ